MQNIFVFDNLVTYILFFSILGFLHFLFIRPHNYKNNFIKNSRFSPQKMSIVVIVIIATLFCSYALNAKPIMAAGQIIEAMGTLKSSGNVDEVIKSFNKVIEYNTFGTTEARERVADLVVQIAVNIDQTNQAFAVLLDYSIKEMEKEALRQPDVARYPVFLGKLYTIQMNLSGKGFETAEMYHNQALELAPNYIQIRLGLAELYLIAGEKQKAINVVKTTFDLPTKHTTLGSLFYPIFSVYILAESFEEALQFMHE
ncbi:tetratricopeptide repeat protein, partial [Patescibacteria group bacterium]